MALSITVQKPLKDEALNWYNRINWRWVFQRLPILALGVDSSRNVAVYASYNNSPLFFQVVSGVTFDLVFVGLIALADQFRSSKKSSTWLFWIINVLAMIFAAIIGTLAHANGYYVNITAESVTSGIFAPLLGLLYNLYYHTITGEAMLEAEKQAEQDRKDFLAKPFACDYCSQRFERVKQRNGHMSTCPLKRAKV